MVPLAASQPNYLAEIEVSEPGRTDNSLGWGEEEEKGRYAGTASGDGENRRAWFSFSSILKLCFPLFTLLRICTFCSFIGLPSWLRR